MKISKKLIEKLKEKALAARKTIATCSSNAKLEHVGSAFSEIDVLTVLYHVILKISPKKPEDLNRDRFILSKGHGALGLYALLEQRGFFSKKELGEYGSDGTKLAGHPVYKSAPGIEFSTGSLGHGLSVGIGLALSAKADNKKWKTFILLSDGECNEGSVWEAIFLAGHLGLDNLVAIIDKNKIQSLGETKDVLNMEPFFEKWKNAGWEAKEIDGHNFEQIIRAFSAIPVKKKKPTVIIANTIKGKGLPYMENKISSHYSLIQKDKLEVVLKSIY